GKFPTWLSPEQVRVLSISEKYNDYAHKVFDELRRNGILATCDDRSEKIGKKILEARNERVPYMLILGQKEEEEGTVSVRSRYDGDAGAKPLATFISEICEEIRTRAIRKEYVEPQK
ncbi:MAG: threonine--tRNA ligase, partial [Bacteroidales bacterium]|nr:threonine--tRNA ligase [Bacteroidales bacterium]